MKIATIIARVFLGLAFMVFGANILHPFMPMPTPPEGSLVAQYFTVMVPTHWMQVVGFFQLLGGLLVLLGRTAPLGLTILAPILINILAFHIFLDNGNGIGGGVVFSLVEIFLVYAYRSSFQGIFCPSAKPTA